MFIPTGLVRESGMIFKCFDEYVDGFTISDEIRKVPCIRSILHGLKSELNKNCNTRYCKVFNISTG